MKYYLHDTNSFNDDKITLLYIHYGFEGLGLFYTILEKIAFQEKPVKTDVLKSQLDVGKKLNKCLNYMYEIGLLQTNNDETFSEQLLNYSHKYSIKKEKNRKKIAEFRENKELSKNVTSYETESNPDKVKISKDKISKDKVMIPTEQEFLEYCKSFLGNKMQSYEFSIKAKYEQWVADKWVDGNGNKIKNWKTKIKNTVPHLKPSNFNDSKIQTLLSINNKLKNEIENEKQ